MLISDSPAIINVNVLRGSCPCACVHCPVGITEHGKRQARFGSDEMTLELFQNIVNQVADFDERPTIRLHSVGEPLLWRHLSKAVRYCREKNVPTWIFTCALGGTLELLRDICENIDIIEVSVNSVSAADYVATKGVDAYAAVSENISYMHSLSPKRLIASRVQTDDAKADAAFADYWNSSGLVNDAFVRSYHDYNRILSGGKSDAEGKACRVHFTRFSIDTDGMAVICFNELFKPKRDTLIELGNVMVSPIKDIWRGEKMQLIRASSLNGNYDDTPGLCCRNCAYCQPIDTTLKTSEHQLEQVSKSGR